MYIERVSIENLRSFRRSRVDFCHPEAADPAPIPNVTLLLGDNGAGKTTLLRAIALSALAPVIGHSGFRPYRLVRRTRTEEPQHASLRGHFRLHPQDTPAASESGSVRARAVTRVERQGDFEKVARVGGDGGRWEGMFHESSPAFLVVGYGASRRVESSSSFDTGVRGKSRSVRYERVSGLFEEHVTLTPLGAWLPELRHEKPERHRQVVALLNTLLPEGTRMVEEPDKREYLFDHLGTLVPFGALSDGYRAFVGWAADLLYHLATGTPGEDDLAGSRGIVLVDEIDLHLHPAWQRTVVPRLARTLPNLQFVLTSHSPLVVGTLHASNLRVIEADETGASEVQRLSEHVHGLTADEILVSSYFGLSTPRAPDAVAELRTLSVAAQQGDEEAAMEFLTKLSESTFSSEERETIAMGAADATSGTAGGKRPRRR